MGYLQQHNQKKGIKAPSITPSSGGYLQQHKISPKKITPTKKPKKITPTPTKKAPKKLIVSAKDIIKKIGDFTIKLISPSKKIITPKVREQIKGIKPTAVKPKQAKLDERQVKKPITIKKPLVLKPKQKKLTQEQMGVIGPTKTFIKPAPKKTVWQKISNEMDKFFGIADTKKARAMNAVQVQKLIKQKTGKTLSTSELAEKGGNIFKNSLMEDVTKELGIRQTVTTKEFGETIMTIAIAAGLATASVTTLTAVGIFAAVSELKSGLISAVKGKGFKLGANQTFSDLFEEAPADVKNILDVMDFLTTAKITHKFYKAQPKAFEKLTKDIIIETKAPRTVNLTAEQVKKINLGLSGKYEADLVKSLELSGNKWKQAVKKGISIEVPTEKLTRIVDKPYWKKVKSIIGAKPTAIETKEIVGAKAREGFAGFLESGEKTPTEVINTVMKSGQEKTVEGKELLKTAMEAKIQGKNIEVTKEVV